RLAPVRRRPRVEVDHVHVLLPETDASMNFLQKGPPLRTGRVVMPCGNWRCIVTVRVLLSSPGMRNGKLGTCVVVTLALALGASGGEGAPRRLRKMVVVGDRVLGGFSWGGFVGHGHGGQVDSAPAFVARRAGVSLAQPLMRGPGVPPQLSISDAN